MMVEATTNDGHTGFTDIPVGEILRRTRLHYEQSFDDVEQNTRIRANLIQALEEGDVEKLPARVYAIGFVRAYSEYLGLDGERMVQLFKQQAGEKVSEPENCIAVTEQETHAPPILLVVVSAFTVFIIAGMWMGARTAQQGAVEVIPPVPQKIHEAAFGGVSTGAVKPDVPDNTQGVVAPAPAQKGIVLNIRKNSWVEIRDESGKRIISRVLKAGDQYFVPDRPGLYMSIGNAAGVEIEIDGQTLKPLGAEAEVRRKIPLDARALKGRYGVH